MFEWLKRVFFGESLTSPEISTTPPPPPKRKIAILGGGVGALTTAFELTNDPGWQDRYEITVYQMGWRLGGKCASSHNPEYGQRIEEHGLHIWLGFYENSFRIIRRCYEELNRPAGTPLATWQEAFKKHSLVRVMEKRQGGWLPWDLQFPTNDAIPGEPGDSLTPWDYVRMLLSWLVQEHDRSPHTPAPAEAAGPIHGEGLREWVEVVLGRMRWAEDLYDETISIFETVFIRHFGPEARKASSHLHRANQLAQGISSGHAARPNQEHLLILWLLEAFTKEFLTAVEEKIEQHDDLRRLWILLRLGVAIVTGMITDHVISHGFDVIDELDFTEWLQRHGATDPEVWWSAPVRGIYELVFGYEDGDTQKPNLAAGTALQGSLRMFFTYKGAIFWKMQGGMADTIFTPFYEVLKNRGVHFEFFHCVRNLGLSTDRQSVETIDIGIQATLKGARGQAPEYQPLVTVKDLPGWPHVPLFDQLVEGDRLRDQKIDLESPWSPWPDVGRRTLKRGEDFDLVVLGIPIGAFPFICTELIAANARWQAMVDHVKTVPTQAFQLWLNRDAAELGWQPAERALLSSYVEPFDTWADMTQLLDREDWQGEDQVGNVSYFCGPLLDREGIPPFTDHEFPQRVFDQVREEAIRFLTSNMAPMLPLAVDPQNPASINWNLLVDPQGGQGADRFSAQYWRANIEPSSRYVLSVKGSTRYRLQAGESGFSNLYLAGDWTYTGINAGCVEAATISAIQAACAILGRRANILGALDSQHESRFPPGPVL